MANTKVGKDQNGKSVVYRLGQDSQGNKSWIKTDEPVPGAAPSKPAIPMKVGAGLGMPPEVRDPIVRGEANERSDYERELALRGPAAQQRAKEAKEMPFLDRALLTMGDEAKSLMTGVEQLMESDVSDAARMTLDAMIAPGTDFFTRDAEDLKEGDERIAKLLDERKTEKELFRELDENAGLAQISRMAPYGITGLAEQPISSAIRSGLGKITQFTRRGKPTPINATGRPTLLPEYLGAATVGAGEGALHDSENFVEGSLSSMIGKLGGRALGPYLERATKTNSSLDEDLIKRYRAKGYNASPGMRTGNPLEQRHDSVQSTDPRFMGWYDKKTKMNNDVLLRDIVDAAGFKLKDGDPNNLSTITPTQLNDQINSLRGEYKALEDNTKGKIPGDDFANIANKISGLPEQDVKLVVKDFSRFTGGRRDDAGKLKLSSLDFDGRTYQDQIRRLKAGKKRALADTNMNLAEVYDDMMKSLADGLEGGMKPDQVSRWRDLNERWAMTSLIKEKGLDVNSKVDTDKLLSEIEANDMDRLVTGKGGRIRAFHDVVKMKGLERAQNRPGMGEGMGDLTDMEKKAIMKRKPSFWSGPERSDTSAWNNMLMNFQYGNTPFPARKVTGLLNLPQQGILSTGGLLRSLEQGTDAKVEAGKSIYDEKKKAEDYIKGLMGED
jgi:hypothetical protein